MCSMLGYRTSSSLEGWLALFSSTEPDLLSIWEQFVFFFYISCAHRRHLFFADVTAKALYLRSPWLWQFFKNNTSLLSVITTKINLHVYARKQATLPLSLRQVHLTISTLWLSKISIWSHAFAEGSRKLIIMYSTISLDFEVRRFLKSIKQALLQF